jgi:hypothetical protein
MGKRELVLVLAFVAVGTILYRFTAPPAPAGPSGGLGGLFGHISRAVRGRPIHASVETTKTTAIEPSVTELRVKVSSAALTVVGEDREDVATTMTVDSDGVDEAEAQRLAKETTLKIDRAGAGLLLGVDFPEDGSQRATLAVHVPKRFIVRVEEKRGSLDIQHVASVDVKGNRGESRLADIDGEVALTHRGATLTIERAGSLRLNATGTDAHVSAIRGTASIDISSSDIELAGVRGPVDVRSRNTDIRLSDAGALQPPLRLDMQSGRLNVEGLKTEARIDGRDTEIRITMAHAAPVSVSDTEDTITFFAPPEGFTLDAIATDASLSLDDGAAGGVSVVKAADERDQRASGAIRGGGPSITLRNTGGDISIRTQDVKEKQKEEEQGK